MPARLRLPSIRAVHLLLAPALIFIAAGLDRQYQTDFWHHLARGQQIVAQGRLLDVDIFTFTVAGQPLRDANWLTQVIYWRLYAWGGLDLVQVVNAGLLAVTLLILTRLCLVEEKATPAERGANGGVSSRAAAIAGAGVFLGLLPFALIRPQTGSFLLFVLLLAVLLRGGWAKWLAAPIMAVWANVHGGFAIGLLLIGAFCLRALLGFFPLSPPWRNGRHGGERGQFLSLFFLLLLSVAATCVNPYGWSIYRYAAGLTARAAGRGIEEWLPPTLNSAGGWVLILWLAGLAGAMAVGRRKPSVLQACLLVCFVPPACRAVRMVPWVMLATAPMLAEMMSAAGEKLFSRRALPPVLGDVARTPAKDTAGKSRRLDGEIAPRPSWSAAILLLLLIGLAGLSVPQLAGYNPLFGRVRSDHRLETDLAAVNSAIDRQGPGRVFTRLEWGDYLGFAAQGKYPIFCDGRIELYPDAIWKEYLQISGGKGDFQRILDRLGVDYLVLDAQYHATLLAQTGRNGSWKTVWRSGHVVLLSRSIPRQARAADAANSPARGLADTR